MANGNQADSGSVASSIERPVELNPEVKRREASSSGTSTDRGYGGSATTARTGGDGVLTNESSLSYSDGIAAARTMLAIEGNTSALQRRLPDGWELAPYEGDDLRGSSLRGANMLVPFHEVYATRSHDGQALGLHQLSYIAFVSQTRHRDTGDLAHLHWWTYTEDLAACLESTVTARSPASRARRLSPRKSAARRRSAKRSRPWPTTVAWTCRSRTSRAATWSSGPPPTSRTCPCGPPRIRASSGCIGRTRCSTWFVRAIEDRSGIRTESRRQRR